MDTIIDTILESIVGLLGIAAILAIDYYTTKIFDGIYGSVVGKKPLKHKYRTEYKKYIGFAAARKFYHLQGAGLEYFKHRLACSLEQFSATESEADFQFKVLDDFTIMVPPQTISFELFHFIVKDFEEHNIKTIGVVRTSRTAYTVYQNLYSELLIGQTDKGVPFFIDLSDYYKRRQFLRVNNYMKEELPPLSVAAIYEKLEQD